MATADREKPIKRKASGQIVAVSTSDGTSVYGEAAVHVRIKAGGIARYASGSEAAEFGAERVLTVWLHNVRGDDRMDAYRAVQNGFPLGQVKLWVETSSAFRAANVLSKIVGASDRTLARRVQEPDRLLTPEQSTRALYFAEIMEKATEVLGSRELAEQWMSEPARGLDGMAPVDLIANAIGYELVNDFLTRMDYGVY